MRTTIGRGAIREGGRGGSSAPPVQNRRRARWQRGSDEGELPYREIGRDAAPQTEVEAQDRAGRWATEIAVCGA
jgi:hypothetical protein